MKIRKVYLLMLAMTIGVFVACQDDMKNFGNKFFTFELEYSL